MGLNWAEHSVEIAAPIETCFAAIIDYETFPSWQSAVVDTEVLDWDEHGRGKRVRLFVDAKVRKVDYTLDYRYDEPWKIEWDFVEGNGINGADGHYLFESLSDGRTRATYKLGLEVGIPLPGPVARRAHKSTLKASVEDLKREAERRAASAADAGYGEQMSAWEAVPDEPLSAPDPDFGDAPTAREADLAEKVGIRQPYRRSVPPLPDAADEWPSEDGSSSVAELPALLAGRAASVGRRVAEDGFETTRDLAAGAASAGLGAARRGVRLGLRIPAGVARRVRGLARDR